MVTYNDSSELVDVVDGSDGFIIINTPNAVITQNSNINVVRLGSTTPLTFTSFVKVLENDPLYIGYETLYKIADSLVDVTDIRPSKLRLDTLSSSNKITHNDPTYTFDSSLFIPTRSINDESICQFSNDIHACSFVYKDIDLITNYLNYSNVRIEYVSNKPNVLSNFGKVSVPSLSEDVTLTANVYFNENLIATSNFNIHVINSESDAVLDMAKTLFYQRIQNHYNLEDNVYQFDRELIVPISIANATFTYVPYKESNADDAVVLFNDSQTKYLSLGTSAITEYTDSLYSFAPTSETKALGVTITRGNSSETFYIKCQSENLIVNNESSIARDIINEWYGGSIVLNKTDSDNNIYESKELFSFDDIDTTKYPSVTNISYELINDTHSLYQLTDVPNSNRKILSVINGKVPEAYVQEVVLSCVFTIDSKTIYLQIQVRVKLAQGDTANSFLPYYTYYDEYIKGTYNNYASKTFELPFAYSQTGPIICYDFAILPDNYDKLDDKTLTDINPLVSNAFVVKLYYNGQVRNTLIYTQNKHYYETLDEILGGTASSIQNNLQTILSYGDAKWIFELSLENAPDNNVNLAMIYNYKLDYTQAGWITYCSNNTSEQLITKLTVAGILHYGTDIVSEVFYKWIYDNFTTITDETGNKLTYTIGDYDLAKTDSSTGKFIIADWLTQNISIDASEDETIASITDFTGLKYLVGTKYLKLTNSSGQGLITDPTMSISIAREISKMKNLETLILTNCTGFTDGKDVSSSENHDNDSISRFVNLKNLKVLNLEGCNVIMFDFMDQMSWLSEVHIANQVIYSNNNYNNFFGNTGISNYWVFGDLTDAGVSVYTTYQGTKEILFEEQKVTNDYTRLKNGPVYQSKLATNKKISLLYETFSTDPDEYHLLTTYSFISGSGTLTVDKSSRTLKYEPVLYKLTSDTQLDSEKTYYIKDNTTQTGYKAVSSPTIEDIGIYYESVDEYHATQFQVVYNFELTSSQGGNVEVNIVVKFNVERYDV